MIRSDHTDNRIQIPAESIIPNTTLGNFVMVPAEAEVIVDGDGDGNGWDVSVVVVGSSDEELGGSWDRGLNV